MFTALKVPVSEGSFVPTSVTKYDEEPLKMIDKLLLLVIVITLAAIVTLIISNRESTPV